MASKKVSNFFLFLVWEEGEKFHPPPQKKRRGYEPRATFVDCHVDDTLVIQMNHKFLQSLPCDIDISFHRFKKRIRCIWLQSPSIELGFLAFASKWKYYVASRKFTDSPHFHSLSSRTTAKLSVISRLHEFLIVWSRLKIISCAVCD